MGFGWLKSASKEAFKDVERTALSASERAAAKEGIEKFGIKEGTPMFDQYMTEVEMRKAKAGFKNSDLGETVQPSSKEAILPSEQYSKPTMDLGVDDVSNRAATEVDFNSQGGRDLVPAGEGKTLKESTWSSENRSPLYRQELNSSLNEQNFDLSGKAFNPDAGLPAIRQSSSVPEVISKDLNFKKSSSFGDNPQIQDAIELAKVDPAVAQAKYPWLKKILLGGTAVGGVMALNSMSQRPEQLQKSSQPSDPTSDKSLFERNSEVLRRKTPEMTKDVPGTNLGQTKGSTSVSSAEPESLDGAKVQQMIANSNANNYGEELKQAQQQMRDELRSADLNEGLGKLGQALARQNENYAAPGAERQRKQAGLPIEQLGQRIEIRKKDPSSDMSKFARQYVKDTFKVKNLPDNISAEELEKIYPQLTQVYNAEENRKSREETAREGRLNREAFLQDKKETRQSEENNKYIERAVKELNKDKASEGMDHSTNSFLAAERALKNPSSQKDLRALYDMVKALDSSSAVREGELKLADSTLGAITGYKNKLAYFTQNPRLVDEKFLTEARDFFKQTQKEFRTRYSRYADAKLATAKQRGIPEERFSEIDPHYETRKQLNKQDSLEDFYNENKAKYPGLTMEKAKQIYEKKMSK
jgi:hypothetical protein